MIGGGLCHRLLGGRFGIGAAEQCLLLAGLGLAGDRLERGRQLALQALLAAFVMRAGVHDDGPVRLLIQVDRSLVHPIGRPRTVLGWGSLGDAAHLQPLIGIDGVEDDALAFVVGRRQARDERAGQSQILLCHHGRIGNVDEGILGNAVFLHVVGNLTEHAVVDLLVRGVAVLLFANDRNIPIDTQQRQHELLEIRALVFAVPMRDVKRHLLIVRRVVVTEDIHRGGIEVHMLGRQRKLLHRRDGQGGKHPLRAYGEDAIHHPPYIVIAERVGGELLAEQYRSITIGEGALQVIQRRASGQGVEHHAQNDHAGLDRHVHRHEPVDDLHQTQAPREIGDDR
jgi:hypothetical protein